MTGVEAIARWFAISLSRQQFPLTPVPFGRAVAVLALSPSEACRRAAAAREALRWDRRNVRRQIEAQQPRLATQGAFLLLPDPFVVLVHRLLHIVPAVLQHPIHQTGQLVGRRRNCPLAADSTLDPPIERRQRRLRPAQRLRRHPQRDRHAVLALTRPFLPLGLVTLMHAWADAEPTGEVLFCWEAANIPTEFGQDHQRCADVDPLNLRQIDPQRLEQRTTGVEAQVVGLAAALGCLATGTSPLSYQWKFNGVNLSAATQSSLNFNVTAADAGSYAATVSNIVGSVTSATASLGISQAPVITKGVIGHTNLVGTANTFSVAATGSAPLGYQWQFNGVNLIGATTTSYTASNIVVANGGTYSVTASKPFALVDGGDGLRGWRAWSPSFGEQVSATTVHARRRGDGRQLSWRGRQVPGVEAVGAASVAVAMAQAKLTHKQFTAK